jgi:hypothetical protein
MIKASAGNMRPRPPRVELPEAELVGSLIVEDEAGDQIAADDEKDVNADKATRERLRECVEDDHQDDGYRPQSVDVSPIGHHFSFVQRLRRTTDLRRNRGDRRPPLPDFVRAAQCPVPWVLDLARMVEAVAMSAEEIPPRPVQLRHAPPAIRQGNFFSPIRGTVFP